MLLSYMEGFLDEEEICALYDVNSTDYPVFEHGKYRRFDLNEVSEEECFSRFRFSDKVIPYLGRILKNRFFEVTRRMVSRGLKESWGCLYFRSV